MDDQLGAQLAALIPKTLDDIVRINRDACAVRLATAEDISPCEREISLASCVLKDRLSDWRLICIDTRPVGGAAQVFVVGQAQAAGTVWNTSSVIGIDRRTGVVLTRSGSCYLLLGPQAEGEPPIDDLIHICVTFHKWGFGQALGVPHFFY